MWAPASNPPDGITALCGFAGGVLIGTPDGAYASDGDRFVKILEAPVTVVAASGESIAAAGGGRVWRSDDGGASWHSPDPLPIPKTASDPMVATSTTVAIGPAGDLWAGVCHSWLSFYPVDAGGPVIHHGAGASECALFRSSDGGWVRRGRHRVYQLAFAGERALIASDNGLRVGDKIVLDRPATCVAVEAGGRIVAGTPSVAYATRGDRGFVAIGPGYRDETGVSNEAQNFSALIRAPSGRVFGATRGLGLAGVFLLDNGRKLRWLGRNAGLLFEPEVGMRSGIEITALAIGANGDGWAASARHGLFHRPGLDTV